MWRSLVSRLNGVQEASSSNLDTRTKKLKQHLLFQLFSFLLRFEPTKYRFPVDICLIPAGRDQHYNVPNLDTRTQKQKEHLLFLLFGPSVEIRTRGLLNPIQARYQTSPHPDILLRCPQRLSILAYLVRKCQYFFQNF